MRKQNWIRLTMVSIALLCNLALLANEVNWFDGFVEVPITSESPTHERVKYRVNIGAGQLMVQNSQLVFQTSSQATGMSETMAIEFENSNNHKVFEGRKSRSSEHIFIVDGQEYYQKAYDEVWIRDVYDFIDLQLFAREDGVKYNFVVRPGGDVNDISLKYTGADLEQINAHSIEMTTDKASLTETMPLVYQDINAHRLKIEGKLATVEQHSKYEIGAYDKAYPLIIDPDVIFTTYLGSTADDEVIDMKFNSNDQLVVLSNTTGADFVSPNSNNATTSGMTNDFVLTKFSKGGESVIWSYYFQGDDFTATALDIEWHASGNDDIVVVGHGSGAVWPISYNTIGSSNGEKGFIATFTDMGLLSGLASFSGNSDDYITDVAFDEDGSVVIVGYTNSTTGFPISSAYQGIHGGGYDAFAAKILINLSTVSWCTYMGGQNDDAYFALDINKENCGTEQGPSPEYGDIHVTGATQNSGFFLYPDWYYNYNTNPAYTPGTSLGVLPTRGLMCWTVYDPSGALKWATDMGADPNGSNEEAGLSIDVEPYEIDGDILTRVLIGGTTERQGESASSIAVPEAYPELNGAGGFQSGNQGGSDGFIMEFQINISLNNGIYAVPYYAYEFIDADYNCMPSMSSEEAQIVHSLGTIPPFKLIFSSLFGGSGDDYISHISYSEAGIYATGVNGSSDFLGSNKTSTDDDAFLVKISGTSTHNSTNYSLNYIKDVGGLQNDMGKVIAFDECQEIYLGGRTYSQDLGTTSAAIGRDFSASQYTGFVTRMSEHLSPVDHGLYAICATDATISYTNSSGALNGSIVDPTGLSSSLLSGNSFDPDVILDAYINQYAAVPLGSGQSFLIRWSDYVGNGQCAVEYYERISVQENRTYVAPSINSSYLSTQATAIQLFDINGTGLTSQNISIQYEAPLSSGWQVANSSELVNFLGADFDEFDIAYAVDYMINTKGYVFCQQTTMHLAVHYYSDHGCLDKTEYIDIDLVNPFGTYAPGVSLNESFAPVYDVAEACASSVVVVNGMNNPNSLSLTIIDEFVITDGTNSITVDNSGYSAFFNSTSKKFDILDAYNYAKNHSSLACAGSYSFTYNILVITPDLCTKIFSEQFNLIFGIPGNRSFDAQVSADENVYAYDFESYSFVQTSSVSYELEITDGTNTLVLTGSFPTGVLNSGLDWDMNELWKYLQGHPSFTSCPIGFDVVYKVLYTDTKGCSRTHSENFELVLPWELNLHTGVDYCALYDNVDLDLINYSYYGTSAAISSVKRTGMRSGGTINQTLTSTEYDDFMYNGFANLNIGDAVDWEEADCSCTMGGANDELDLEISYSGLEFESCTYTATDEILLIHSDVSSSLLATSVVLGQTPLKTTGSDYDLNGDPYKYSYCYSSDITLSTDMGNTHSWYLWDKVNDLAIEKLGDGNNFLFSVDDHITSGQWIKCAMDGMGVCPSTQGLHFKIELEGVRAPLPTLEALDMTEGCDYDEADLCGYDAVDNILRIEYNTDDLNANSISYNPGFTDPADNVFKPKFGEWESAGHNAYVTSAGSGAVYGMKDGFYQMSATDFYAPGAGCPTVKSKLLRVKDVAAISQTTSPSSATIICPVTSNDFEVNITSSGSYSYELWDTEDPSITHNLKEWSLISSGYSTEDIQSEGHYAYRLIDNSTFCYSWTNSVEFEDVDPFQIQGGVDEVIMNSTSPYAELKVDNGLIPTYYGVVLPVGATSSQTDWYRDGVFEGNGSHTSNQRTLNVTNDLKFGYYHAEAPYGSYCTTSLKAKSNVVNVKAKCVDLTNPPAGPNVAVWNALVPTSITNPTSAITLLYVSGVIDITSHMIFDGITVIMSPGSELVVKAGTSPSSPGGKLTISGSTLIGCQTWNGITVEGDLTYPGELTITDKAGSNSVLMNAVIGVYSKDGAEVQIDKTTFGDNHVDILIGPNANANNSVIQDNIFEGKLAITPPSSLNSHAYFLAPGSPQLDGVYIYLDGCNTVEIRDNTFNSKQQYGHFTSDHFPIMGVHADDIELSGSSQYFDGGFKYCVWLQGCDGWDILDQTFGSGARSNDIETGLRIEASDTEESDDNDVERCVFQEITTGLYSKDCNNLNVLDSEFKNLQEDGLVFLSELASQQLCTIKKNLFYGNKFGLSIGRDDHPTKDQTNISQDKRNIKFTCNKFIENQVAILITADTRSQGNSTGTDAGNMFNDPVSAMSSANLDYDIMVYQGISFEYYYHDPSSCSSTFSGYEPNSDQLLGAWTGHPLTAIHPCSIPSFGTQYTINNSAVDHRRLLCYGHHIGIKPTCDLSAGTSSTGVTTTTTSACDYGSWKKGTSIEPEPTTEQEINIYPNPFRNTIHIDLPEGIQGRIQVRNLVGQLIYEGVSTPDLHTIPTSGWPSGAYVVLVQSKQGETLIQKLIKAN